ncbi:hypothetical protein D3C87_1767850 [compost metagenome]
MFGDGHFDDFLQNRCGASRVDRDMGSLGDEADELLEIFIVSGGSDGTMEGEIGDDAVFTPFFRAGHLR